MISSDTQRQLERRMERMHIREEDLAEHFVRSSGPGVQKVNRSETCVVLHHVPSGLRVKCQIHRTQGMNRFFARRLLCEKMEELEEGKKSARRQAAEKIRRQKRRRSRRAKEKMLETKKRQGEKKRLRQSVRIREN